MPGHKAAIWRKVVFDLPSKKQLLYPRRSSMVRALFVSACLLMVVAGCGGGGGATNPAEADCDDFVENVLCPQLQACGASYSSVGSCIAFFENSSSSSNPLYCATVTVEYAGLPSCESDVDNYSCGALVNSAAYATLPSSCIGIFN
jgi:hypothetical protein